MLKTTEICGNAQKSLETNNDPLKNFQISLAFEKMKGVPGALRDAVVFYETLISSSMDSGSFRKSLPGCSVYPMSHPAARRTGTSHIRQPSGRHEGKISVTLTEQKRHGGSRAFAQAQGNMTTANQ